MQKFSISILIICAIFAVSCTKKPGKVHVHNAISNTEITDVKWGDFYLASSLLPGQTSSEVKVEQRDEKLPSSQYVTFIMKANNKQVYLQTVDKFTLEEDERLVITINDDTRVTN